MSREPEPVSRSTTPEKLYGLCPIPPGCVSVPEGPADNSPTFQRWERTFGIA